MNFIFCSNEIIVLLGGAWLVVGLSGDLKRKKRRRKRVPGTRTCMIQKEATSWGY